MHPADAAAAVKAAATPPPWRSRRLQGLPEEMPTTRCTPKPLRAEAYELSPPAIAAEYEMDWSSPPECPLERAARDAPASDEAPAREAPAQEAPPRDTPAREEPLRETPAQTPQASAWKAAEGAREAASYAEVARLAPPALTHRAEDLSQAERLLEGERRATDAPTPELPFGSLSWLTRERFDEARSAPIRTLRAVPKGAEKEYSQANSECKRTALSHPDPLVRDAYARAAHLFDALVLAAPARIRGGKRKRAEAHQRLKIVQKRLKDLGGGRGDLLLRNVRLGPRATREETDAEQEWRVLQREILRLCSLGEDGRAARLLSSPGLAPENASSLETMRKKLSQEARRPVVPAEASAEARRRIQETLATGLPKAVRQAPRGSAAGALGGRYDFYKTLLFACDSDQWAWQVDWLAAMAAGDCPEELTDAWRVGRSFALRKAPGSADLRPIVAHEPARRLVARALVAPVAKEATSDLTPLQAGVGLPGGAEAAGLAARQHAERNPGHTVIKLDLRNAYGETQRAVAVEELAEVDTPDARALLLFVSLMLGEPSLVHFAGSIIVVADGLDQGDPAAPLLFSLALQPLLKALRDTLPEGAFIGAYLDDVTLIVPPERAVAALEAAERLALAHGYAVQRGTAERPKSLATSVTGERPVEWPLPWAEEGFAVAGVPIPRRASPAVARQVADAAVQQLEVETDTLRRLCEEGPSGRARVTSARRLILLCLQRRLDFLSRVTEPASIRAEVDRFDDVCSSTLRSLLQLPAEMPDHTVAQIFDSPAHGGLGLTALEPRLEANFVDGALSAAPHIAAATGAGPMMLAPDLTAFELALEASAAHVVEASGCEPPSWLARAAGIVAHRRWGAEAVQAMREKARHLQQLHRKHCGVGHAARVDSCSGPGAGWFMASAAAGGAELLATEAPKGPPLRVDGLELSDAEERALVHYRLGLFERPGGCRRESKDPRKKPADRRCKKRGDASVSAHHLSYCPFGGWTIMRHNKLARLLQLLVLEIAGADVRWTPRTGHWRRGKEDAEPDLRIDIPGWRTLYVDVAVVVPTSGTPGCAAYAEEREKELAYPLWVKKARVVNCDFSPFVVETFGRFGERARLLIGRLAAQAAKERGASVSAEIARWQQLLSLRLMKDQADLLING